MSKKNSAWNFATRAIHIGNQADHETGAVSPPIYFTSTYVQDAVGEDRGFVYSRTGNPTRARFEQNIADLESGKFGFAFSSGMAAITALLQTFKSEDHVVISRNVYGGTYRLVDEVVKHHGLAFDFIDTRTVEDLRKTLKPETRLILVETPTNPLLELADIEALAQISHQNDCLFAVDNTFMSPYGQRPLELGADIVIHSSTKYIGGHSDVVAGALVVNDEVLADRIYMVQKSAGAIPSPFDAWILLRSTKTLALRVQQQSDNALALARWLSENHQPPLTRVIYPGLRDHPQYDLAVRQQKTPQGKPIFGSIISIDLGSVKARDAFLDTLEIFTFAESLGGVESLISNPFYMTHGSVPREDKLAMGITEGLIRLSIGIEDIDDLKLDIQHGLEAVRQL